MQGLVQKVNVIEYPYERWILNLLVNRLECNKIQPFSYLLTQLLHKLLHKHGMLPVEKLKVL